MIIKISPDIKTQEIWANGVELASIMGLDRKNGKRVITCPVSEKKYVYTFHNPLLMTDNYRIGKLNPTMRDTLFALYSSRPRIVEYDSVNVFWDSSHLNVWCPSIDTLLFAKGLREVLRKYKFKSVAEIGCGSGFLSKYILDKSKSLMSMLIIDINPYAIKCARDNIKDKRASFFVGDGMKRIQNEKFDLLICNPPYVPREGSIDDNPYEGFGLLNHLLHEGQKYLNPNGVIIINISSLCKDKVLKDKVKMKMKLIEKMRVPLKVNNILNNKRWVAYLRKCGMKKKLERGYEYWQDLFIYQLDNK